MNFICSQRKFDPELTEMMDQPDPSRAELIGALENLRILNRYFGSHRIIRHFLRRWIRQGDSLSILDACTGFGDIPRLVVNWARIHQAKVQVLAIDFQSATLDIARQRSEEFPEIRFQQADLRSFNPGRPFDVVLCSLALHHFAWPEAVEILRTLERLADRAVLVSDLERSLGGMLGVYLLTSTIFRNPMTRFDGRLSIRRAFSFPEMRRLAVEAGWHGFRHRRFLANHQVLWLKK
ncbi:MAG: methyltransferase domain-containing protein [Verrucomicrobia bacterium]|nr:methyltransferase domain-containing protein [Verrucomicrobiota bacterium]